MTRFDTYDPGEFYDEMFAAPSHLRPQARLLEQRVQGLPDQELRRRQQAAERALLQMGITFNVYSDEGGTEKIFPFDIIPRIIDAQEWSWIERGLRQRIQALNLFINDIYHEQKIVKDRIVPEELVRSASGFRPACIGLAPPQGVWCHITGTDLVRDRAGQIYVLEDNLRCPSGVSYVLENRLVMKRTFPLVFDASGVRPIDDYPSHLFAMLASLAPDYVPSPTVAVLTPGMYNSAYFEHSFLAQQMGVELVEGRDLVVADGVVQMRTTNGLERVDILYRRIDDDFLDPRVFRTDSLLSVPGLMDVYREGRIALANAPGTGIADDKVIYAYVPKMISYYLAEDPIIPNVPTYLCWDEKDRTYVLDHLDQLVVKAANESGGYGMLVGPHASQAERAQFAKKIQAKPRNYIAQPTLALSRVPVLVDDHFEGRHVDLRPFILYGKDMYVLPGGLTRVALKKGSLVVNSSQGGGSKDTWVLSDAPAQQLRSQNQQNQQNQQHQSQSTGISPPRTGEIMLSRVAEAIYWMSRYVERAENVARVIDVNLHLMLDLPSGMQELWRPVVRTTGDEEAFAAQYGAPSREHVVRFLTFDLENPNSILACLRAARENARSVREVISSEMWEQVNTFFLMVNAATAQEHALDSPHDFFTAVKQASHLFEGLTNATMSYGEGWHFCRMGRLLERADKTSRILDIPNLLALPTTSALLPQLDTLQWAAVLRSTSAFEMYRKRYHNLVPAQIVEFLLLDRDFPRSVHHCVTSVDESLRTLSGAPPATFRNPAEQHLGRLRAELAYSEVQDILDNGLHEFVDALQTKLDRVGDSIFATFFALRPIGGTLLEESKSI